MKATCYWCNKEIIGTVKRCSRCRLTTYCSKSCQASSWKAGHRTNCTPHDSLAHGQPEKWSDEWRALELDKVLSRWLEEWRTVLRHFAVIALNLPNHGPERVATHCMTVWVQPNFMHEDKIRDYYIYNATVESIASLAEQFPNLKGLTSPSTPYTPVLDDAGTTFTMPDSPTVSSSSSSEQPEPSSSGLDIVESGSYDPTRVRFVLILQNYKQETQRVRCCLWNDLNIPRLRAMPKQTGDELAKDWDMILMYTVEKMLPRDLEEKLGSPRRTTRSRYD
ncbi:hypothetical protein NM688_g3041 [Phlebia brevispora]|uniref:Uncharacterized protein n=1 Tax=Phlebia brevispora TaxID=194682 RepID=A0ACC1T6T1_9APHY|nr:hypothetical protein NM688_g3041 [Phlebia brevispora]